MSAKCQFCEREFRSTPDREKSGVCMICHNIGYTVKAGILLVGKKVVDRILAAVENGESSLEG
jgi:hypothetical protein